MPVETPPADAAATPPQRGVAAPLLHLYIDETGIRNPDHKPDPNSTRDWFALGGIIIKAEDEDGAKSAHQDFYHRWPAMRCPLHMTDMLSERKGFAWLGKLGTDDIDRFWSEYRRFLTSLPVLGAACVIDRPGYTARGYTSLHGDKRWMLCRSAFDILMERAAKFAIYHGRRIRLFYEGANPTADQMIEGYFHRLRTEGLAFDPAQSAKYTPLNVDSFAATLLSIERKDKSSRMMQVADSYVYALSRGKYDRKFPLYRRIIEKSRMINSAVPSEIAGSVAVKYYCFDAPRP